MNHLLMCPPYKFGVSYEINPHMNGNIGSINKTKAIEQWSKLYVDLVQVAKVDLIYPEDDSTPDMVFTANGGLVTEDKFIVPRFRYGQRQGEENHFQNWALSQGFNTIRQNTIPFEGEGDCLFDGTIYWFGYGPRSAQRAHEIARLAGIDDDMCNILHLVDRRFYHLDTCFFPVTDKIVIYYPGAFNEQSIEIIKNCFENKITVTEEEALQFCCNAIRFDNDIYMPQCRTVASDLRVLFGYKVHQYDMSEFIKSGGAVKCLILTIAKDDWKTRKKVYGVHPQIGDFKPF